MSAVEMLIGQEVSFSSQRDGGDWIQGGKVVAVAWSEMSGCDEEPGFVLLIAHEEFLYEVPVCCVRLGIVADPAVELCPECAADDEPDEQ